MGAKRKRGARILPSSDTNDDSVEIPQLDEVSEEFINNSDFMESDTSKSDLKSFRNDDDLNPFLERSFKGEDIEEEKGQGGESSTNSTREDAEPSSTRDTSTTEEIRLVNKNKLGDDILEDNKLGDDTLEDNKLGDEILEDNKLDDDIFEDASSNSPDQSQISIHNGLGDSNATHGSNGQEELNHQVESHPTHDIESGNATHLNGTHVDEDNNQLNGTIITPPAPPGASDTLSDLIPPSVSASSQKTALSYSQQQSDVFLQSPAKRREVQVVKSNEPRLVINKLELTNFKSYAGKQVIGPFNTSFSAVVGPNGSGKSNVIDSMLFVFGFRALKMRQGKLSELIHNSTGGEKLGFCQVDIHFQHVLDVEGKPAQVIANSELVISRKALRNNQSLYYVNGKSSTYTEVTTFLKEKGIDLDHKRFLILQGEVESIAQMKAKGERENDDGLLEYLEDIIGTTRYKKLIEDNLVKVEQLNEICLEKENRFELVEKDKDSLTEKKNEALRFLSIEKKLTNKKSIQYQADIHENKKVLQEHQASIDLLTEKLEDEKKAIADILKGVQEFVSQQDLAKQNIVKINTEISLLTKKQKETNKHIVSLEERNKNLNSKVKKIIKLKELLEHSLTTSTQKLSTSNDAEEQDKAKLDEEDQKLEAEKAKLDEIRKSLTAKTSQFTNQIESLQAKLQPWNDKIKEKENLILLANSALEMLVSQKESIGKQIHDTKRRIRNIKKEGQEKEAEFHESEEELSKITTKIAIDEEQCALERKELDRLRLNLANTRQKTQDSVSSLSNFQNKNKVLSSLLRLAKSGRIDGFHGRLGDLGIIDDVYDIAISTACPGLDSMVVDTVETAQACVDYLKKNKLGYASFICLDKLRKFNLDPIQTPGNPAIVKRLFDLIRPTNPKFAPAFYSKLFNCLVAPDLKEAKKVAYGAKRWKVVTTDGKVVDTSGAMSGGGNHFVKGGMRLTNSNSANAMDISPEDVDLMQEDLKKLEGQFETAEQQFKAKEDELKRCQNRRPDLEFLISRLRLDIESLSSEKKELLSVYKTLMAENEESGESSKFDEQIKEKEFELALLNQEKTHLRSQTIDLEDQIKILEMKIMDAGGIELKMQNSKVDSIKQNMEIINQRAADNRMAIRKLENEVKRHTKVIEQSTGELESATIELEKIQQDQRERAQDLESLNELISKLDDEKNDLESELEKLRVELEEKNEQINSFKSIEIEIENKMEKHNAYIKRAKKSIHDSTESLEGLVIRDVKPYIDWMEEEEQNQYDGAVLEEIKESDLEEIELDDINSEINSLENVLNNIKVDIEVLKEYGTKKLEYESRRTDLNLAVEERDQIKNYCEDLKRKRLDEFMEGFNTISMTLKDMYRMITMGGNAELELVDSLDPFSEGILFSVMPPKKSWKNISNLSGGEKTLSSLALVFALHQYKPTPLYVMDEIDAALDFRNVSIVANYIKERTKNAQFIVISLRNNMFELAQQLVGIYKIDNKTKSISLQNKDFLGNEA